MPRERSSTSASSGGRSRARTVSDYVEEELEKYTLASPPQRRISVYICLVWALTGWQVMSRSFVMQPVDKLCLPGQDDTTCLDWKAVSEDYCKDPNSFASYEFSNTGKSLIADFRLECSDFKVVATGLIFFAGFLVGAPAFASVADSRGRKAAFFTAWVIFQAGALIAVLAPGYYVYALARGLLGAGMGGLLLSTFVWNSEIIGPKSRIILPASTAASYAAGVLVLPLLALCFTNWRALCFVIFLSGLPFVAITWYYKDSPKWLAVMGREDEAIEIMKSFASTSSLPVADFDGAQEDPPAGTGAIEDRKAADSESSPVSSGDSNAVTIAEQQSVVNILLLDNRLSQRFIFMCFTWFALSMAYYGLAMNLKNLGWPLTKAIVVGQTLEMPSYFLAVPMMDSQLGGRRGTMAATAILAGICCLVAPQLVGAAGDGGEVPAPSMSFLSLVFFGKACVALSFTVIYLYAAELFPTDVRSRAMGMQSCCARVGGMLAPVLGKLGEKNMTLALFLVGFPCLLCGAMLLALPETRGKRIPDTVDDVEPSPWLLDVLLNKMKAGADAKATEQGTGGPQKRENEMGVELVEAS